MRALLRALLAERRRTNELLAQIATNTAKPAPVTVRAQPAFTTSSHRWPGSYINFVNGSTS